MSPLLPLEIWFRIAQDLTNEELTYTWRVNKIFFLVVQDRHMRTLDLRFRAHGPVTWEKSFHLWLERYL